ncbi:unnamed protein product [Cyprideis torosa]|uniref:Uncharacterized protein n=1 Tax=Cyprideis torosa TaxID=163714 RepID=A0A7R8ZXU9_9CRUS|nr:unnamed protein product [Cyprideis torosa]CAG0907391.1 unnamed protein product [Cyprideis torosa]
MALMRQDYKPSTEQTRTSLMEIPEELSKSRNSSLSPPSTGFLSVTDTDNAAVDGSTLDMASDQPVSQSQQDKCYKSFQPFLEDDMDICGSSHRVTDLPIQVENHTSGTMRFHLRSA